MRITLAVDDDILAATKHLAERDRKTVGEVISRLARQGLAHASSSTKTERNGVPLLPRRHSETPVTLELINRFRDGQP